MNSLLLSHESRLELLRKNDPLRCWTSLDDRRTCMGCGRKLTGRMIRISWRGDRVHFECPTPDCVAGVAEFAAEGDPFLDEDVWNDWERTLKAIETAASEEPSTRVPYEPAGECFPR